jgi:RimJ/RimL family protein N-acetyltransferase
VQTKQDAAGYIQKILSNPDIHYRVVKLANQPISVGVVTFIKRDYLDHPDIGFAFLPQHAKQGYAFEASRAVLHDLCATGKHATVLATTIKENMASVQLLKKLGFSFRNEIKTGTETLHVYVVTTDKLNMQG